MSFLSHSLRPLHKVTVLYWRGFVLQVTNQRGSVSPEFLAHSVSHRATSTTYPTFTIFSPVPLTVSRRTLAFVCRLPFIYLRVYRPCPPFLIWFTFFLRFDYPWPLIYLPLRDLFRTPIIGSFLLFPLKGLPEIHRKNPLSRLPLMSFKFDFFPF